MITKRILTLKSKVGRGKYPNEEIGRLIACDCSNWVRYVYYHYEDIDFMPDVKKAAGIVEEIQKPGVDDAAFWRNERAEWNREREEMGEEAYMHRVNQIRKTKRINKRESKTSDIMGQGFTKGLLQSVNHGHSYIKGK